MGRSMLRQLHTLPTQVTGRHFILIAHTTLQITRYSNKQLMQNAIFSDLQSKILTITTAVVSSYLANERKPPLPLFKHQDSKKSELQQPLLSLQLYGSMHNHLNTPPIAITVICVPEQDPFSLLIKRAPFLTTYGHLRFLEIHPNRQATGHQSFLNTEQKESALRKVNIKYVYFYETMMLGI